MRHDVTDVSRWRSHAANQKSRPRTRGQKPRPCAREAAEEILVPEVAVMSGLRPGRGAGFGGHGPDMGLVPDLRLIEVPASCRSGAGPV